MADKQTDILVPPDTTTNAEDTAEGVKPGSKPLDVYAWADPASMFMFKVAESIVKHFNIDRAPDGVTTAKLYEGKSNKTPKNPKRQIKGGKLIRRGRKILKAIKLPVGKEEPIQRKIKGQEKTQKFVTIRVPGAMSINAISVWINNQFEKAANKPTYFLTASGSRVEIDKNYKNKTELNDIGLKGTT